MYLWGLLFPCLLGVKLLQLLETMLVDDRLKVTVRVVADVAVVIEDHHLTIAGGVRSLVRKSGDVRIPRVRECRPGITHDVRQTLIAGRRVRQLVPRVVESVEAEFQLMPMHRALVHRRTPREHISIYRSIPASRCAVRCYYGLRTEKAVG